MCTIDPTLLTDKAQERLEFSLRLLRATQSRPPNFACHGLHEWAMVYRGEEVRHEETAPLRLSQQEINALERRNKRLADLAAQMGCPIAE